MSDTTITTETRELISIKNATNKINKDTAAAGVGNSQIASMLDTR